MPVQKFSLGVFQQVNADMFIVSDKNGHTVWSGSNPIDGMVVVQGMYETAIRKQFLPPIFAEGYNRLGVKTNDPRGVQQNRRKSGE